MSNKFYELQEWAGGAGQWRHCAFFKTKKQAKKHSEEFNTLVTVNKIRIIEREFSE